MQASESSLLVLCHPNPRHGEVEWPVPFLSSPHFALEYTASAHSLQGREIRGIQKRTRVSQFRGSIGAHSN